MDDGTTTEVQPSSKPLGGYAWTAYFGIGILALVLLIVCGVAAAVSARAGIIALALTAVFITYHILLARSYKLYYDDVGVWLYSGVLPWKKGRTGVKWRDLDEAVYFTTFWSWLSKSYTIRIRHRFTKSSEIALTHVARGNDIVAEINSRHQQLIRSNALA
jgi:hypothetical protein